MRTVSVPDTNIATGRWAMLTYFRNKTVETFRPATKKALDKNAASMKRPTLLNSSHERIPTRWSNLVARASGPGTDAHLLGFRAAPEYDKPFLGCS
mmetsp:Transcript_12392/g.33447  ORF Transcript_12392/g.33447 Transcript_12392/m.33447 type:complete len:96 (-) Transcript_12392:170-457(-)